MATTSPPKPAPLGGYRNPYEFLRAADEEQARALAELKKADTLTHQAAEELRQEHRRALSLAEANHRGRIRALASHMLQTRYAAPMGIQSDFLAVNRGGCTVLSLVSLIAAEVTANDYPHDLPFHPDALELADAIRRNHFAALQIVKDWIRTGALPVRAVTGLPVACNDDPAVLAWCNDLAAVTPPRALCTTLADARAFVQAAGLNPLRELAGELVPPSDQVPNVPAEEVPADLEEPKQTRRMTEAKKAIRAILRTADRRSLSRSAAYDFVVVAIRDGNVPSPYQMEEEKDESGGRVFVWTDTKGEKQRLRPDTLRRYVREAWDEL